MDGIRAHAGEIIELYAALGVLPLDGFTGGPPLGRISAFLDIHDGLNWHATGRAAVRTPGGVIAYPGLEKRAEVLGQLPRRYRVRLAAEFYQPFYRRNADGLEFEVFPYNDHQPPANWDDSPFVAEVISTVNDVGPPPRTTVTVKAATGLSNAGLSNNDDIHVNGKEYVISNVNQVTDTFEITPALIGNQRWAVGTVIRRLLMAPSLPNLHSAMLLPAPNYPFPAHLPVLRGQVVDKLTREPATDVEVFWQNRERALTMGPPEPEREKAVLTVARGAFALPMRITEKLKPGTQAVFVIDAVDHRTGRAGSLEIKIPAVVPEPKITVTFPEIIAEFGRNHIIEIAKP